MNSLEKYIVGKIGCLPATFSDKALKKYDVCGPRKHAEHNALYEDILQGSNYTELRANFSRDCLPPCEENYFSASILQEEVINLEEFFEKHPQYFEHFYTEYPGQTFFSYSNPVTGTAARMKQGMQFLMGVYNDLNEGTF